MNGKVPLCISHIFAEFYNRQFGINILTWQLVVSPSALGTIPLAVTKHFGCVVLTQGESESHLHTPSVTSHLLVAPLVEVATPGRHEPVSHYECEKSSRCYWAGHEYLFYFMLENRKK